MNNIDMKNTFFTVRQDRLSLKTKNLHLKIDKDEFEVTNFSLFGVAFKTDKKLQIGDIYCCELKYNEMKVSDFSIEIKRLTKIEDVYEYGSEVIDTAVPIEEISYIDRAYSSISETSEISKRYMTISSTIRNHIDDLYMTLTEIEARVKSIEAESYENNRQKKAAHNNYILIIGSFIYDKLKTTNEQIGKIVAVEENSKLIFEYYRYRLGKFIFQSPFTKRSFEKPKGYAGDYEMMNQLYRNDSFANSLFGACMEKAVSLHEEPSAVRNRVNYLSEKIIDVCKKRSSANILAVASGPAEEIKFTIKNLPKEILKHVTFNLLDQDEEALRYAQKNIRETLLLENKEAKINLISKDIKTIITNGLTDKYDLIYSAGLFDYFSDPVASRAAKALHKSLNESSQLIIGNFNSTAPNTFGMLALFDWYLILRSEKDLLRIFNISNTKITIEHEEKKVNLFCVIEK